MGYDISYHPINKDEMYEFYFNRLDELKSDDFSGIEAVAHKYGIGDFYLQKYKDTMCVAANTTDTESFDKTHSYYLAVVQGFLRTFYYTRGTGFTFLIQQHEEMGTYTTSFSKILDRKIENPIQMEYSKTTVEEYISPMRTYQSFWEIIKMALSKKCWRISLNKIFRLFLKL